MSHIFHAQYVYCPGPYISHGLHRQPFASPHMDEIGPIHLREVLATEDRLARPSSWVTSFPLPHDSLGVGERDFGQVVTQLHQLTGP
jgi:hypothetical protein